MSPKGMPAELMNELFGSLPLENAFGLLAKMTNALLARNVLKMINGIKMAMKDNKLNEEDCGPKLEILEDGYAAKHTGPNYGRNIIRAVLPIPSLNLEIMNRKIIVSYFEIENKIRNGGIVIGFCDPQFALEDEWLGWERNSNSIGIYGKERMFIAGSETYFENKIDDYDYFFKKGDFVGFGIINQPNSKNECFATWNGKLLGKYALPPKFAKLQLFPAVNWTIAGESIRANFGKEEWQFKEFGRVLE